MKSSKLGIETESSLTLSRSTYAKCCYEYIAAPPFDPEPYVNRADISSKGTRFMEADLGKQCTSVLVCTRVGNVLLK